MPGGKIIKSIEESGYKYLGIFEVKDEKHEDMKGQLRKEYIRRFRNILQSKLNRENITSDIN